MPATPVRPEVPKVIHVERGPVPDVAALIRASELLAGQLKAGETRDDRLAAADRLVESSRAAGEDRAARYILLKRAAELAAGAVDLDFAFAIVGEQNRYFEVDAAEARRSLFPLAAAGASAPEQHEAVALLFLEMTRPPLDEPVLEAATRLAIQAEAAAIKARKPAVSTRVRDRAADLRLAKSLFEQLKPALEKLRTSSEDPLANLFVGRYRCYVQHDWEQGLPHLAKSMDINSKTVARQELVQMELAESDPSVPPDPRAWLKIAERWNAMARGQSGLVRSAQLKRAVHWYRKAYPLLGEADRVDVEKRLVTVRLLAPDLPELAELERTAKVGGDGGGEFEDVMADRAPLVGLRFQLADYVGHKVIGAIRPIFAAAESGGRIRNGTQHGASSRGGAHLARPGYAIGGLVAKGGLRVDGFKIVFMRLRPDGTLDPNDKYEGNWIGGQGGGSETVLGCDGRTVVGIFGRVGLELDAIGLVQKN